jgi:hypothetical protein
VFSTYRVAGASIALILTLLVISGIRGPATPVQAAPSGSVSPTGTSGIFQLTIFVDDDIATDAILRGFAAGTPPGSNAPDPGRFSECHRGDISGPPCSSIASCPSIGTAVMAFTATCLANLDPDGISQSQQITLLWTCSNLPGPVGFDVQQGVLVLVNGQPVDCTIPGTGGAGGSGSQPAGGLGSICVSGNCVALTANPNVVSCKGGSTTVTAFAHYQLPVVVPATPIRTAPNGAPLAQQPFFFFTVTKGIALLQQTSNNTAVVTMLEGMPEAEITATTGGVTNTIRIPSYCRPGTAGVTGAPSAAGTPGAAPVGTPVPTPAPVGSLTISASPPSLSTCDGSLFLSATVRDSNGKLVPDGTNVLFIATRGILDPASANTTVGTANVVYTADLKSPGTITLSAQSGSAFASVSVPVTCGGSGGATGSATSGSLGASPSGSPNFTPPSTGEGGASIRIRPPSTGEAGLKVSEVESPAATETLLHDRAPLVHFANVVPGIPCADRQATEVKS